MTCEMSAGILQELVWTKYRCRDEAASIWPPFGKTGNGNVQCTVTVPAGLHVRAVPCAVSAL